MPEAIVYADVDRPDVEVLWEGVWCPGEVRMVRWVGRRRAAPGPVPPAWELSSHIDDFAAWQVRADTVDHSEGRT